MHFGDRTLAPVRKGTNQEIQAIPRLLDKNDPALKDKDIRLIDQTNEQIGIVPFIEACEMAGKEGKDLVLVADQSDPPVCRIMNFGKYRYEKKRRGRDQKRKQASHKCKEIKFHANIDPHDYTIKLKHIRTFLEKGFKVKVSLFFRGREMRNTEQGMVLMNKVVQNIEDIGMAEAPPRRVGRNIGMYLSPISHK